jgi:hypothetical protein
VPGQARLPVGKARQRERRQPLTGAHSLEPQDGGDRGVTHWPARSSRQPHDQSSQTRKIIERLYAYSADVNSAGQWSYYGKVGGALTTGNEDGGKHVSAQILYALQHIGLAIPPQSDAYWNGEAGPGPSYLDPESGGQENVWTLRNTVFMTWNVLHLARMLKDAGGFPAHGNSTHDWNLSQPTHPNPEFR